MSGPVKRNAVISGAERGLGRAIAHLLGAEAGVRVVVTSRERALAQAVVDEVVAAGGDAVAEVLDVSDQASVEAFAGRAARALGGIDILVNNAGICIDDRDSAIDANLDVVRRTLETNLFGAWRLSKAVLPLMRDRRPPGRIVNVSSSMGQLESMQHDSPAYRLSKTALNCLTGMLASELQATGILVNAVDPGWMRTDMGGSSAPLSALEGAAEPVRLALLGPEGSTGGFYFRGRLTNW